MAEKVEKITRGYNLSKANVMWLVNKAMMATVQKPRGTVSASEVLEPIVTAARLKDEEENGKWDLSEFIAKKVKG